MEISEIENRKAIEEINNTNIFLTIKKSDKPFARQTKKKKEKKIGNERGDIITQLREIKRILKDVMNNFVRLDNFNELHIVL